MPGEPGVTVVTLLACFSILHARLRAHRSPGIPCALSAQTLAFVAISGEVFYTTRAQFASRECGVTSMRGAKATKQSSYERFPGLLRFARNDGRWRLKSQ